MSNDIEILAGQRLVASVRNAFPDEALFVDKRLAEDFYDVEESPHTWLERFSQLTTDAIKDGDRSKALAHLKLLSSLLTAADEPTARCIDVAYVESLLWDIADDDAIKFQGWQLIPSNLQAQYLAMWGERPFMHGIG